MEVDREGTAPVLGSLGGELIIGRIVSLSLIPRNMMGSRTRVSESRSRPTACEIEIKYKEKRKCNLQHTR
jgi:hypothetical protein